MSEKGTWEKGSEMYNMSAERWFHVTGSTDVCRHFIIKIILSAVWALIFGITKGKDALECLNFQAE